MTFHPAVIQASIENATAGAITRRKAKPVWPVALCALMSILGLVAALLGVFGGS
jgi:hypothetical protein